MIESEITSTGGGVTIVIVAGEGVDGGDRRRRRRRTEKKSKEGKRQSVTRETLQYNLLVLFLTLFSGFRLFFSDNWRGYYRNFAALRTPIYFFESFLTRQTNDKAPRQWLRTYSLGLWCKSLVGPPWDKWAFRCMYLSSYILIYSWPRPRPRGTQDH